MNNISKLIWGVCLSATLFSTGCIEETFPTDKATEDQLGSSSKATESLLWAMPAYFNKYGIFSNRADYDWGYGSIMHIRDVMTEDMAVAFSGSGYDWYDSWQQNIYQDNNKAYCQYIWTYYYKLVQTANNMIAAIDVENANDTQLGYLGAGYAFRALAYLDIAQMFEFLENDGTSSVNISGNNVLNLTAPIVKEGMTEEEARNNPRATREKMAEFILEDLKKAETYIVNLTETSHTLPHLDAVYGLMARYYMWLGEYSNAKECARKAINSSSSDPMTEDECLNTTKGFNDLSCWMWGSQLKAEDDQVKTGIITWISWMSNETTFGYSAQEPFLMINRSMYERLSDTDFRKKMWKAPQGSALDGMNNFLDEKFKENLPDYASLKFRPNEGNYQDPLVGNAAAFPVMRIEEMYFIEAEAAAHLNAGEGRTLLEDFMKKYRDPSYVCSNDDVVDEVVFQKRVELWGEGTTFFDVKRLDLPVVRGYEGTNFNSLTRFNTTGRPAWMNISIVVLEENNNNALIGWGNPDPSGVYQPWTEK